MTIRTDQSHLELKHLEESPSKSFLEEEPRKGLQFMPHLSYGVNALSSIRKTTETDDDDTFNYKTVGIGSSA